MGKITQGYKKRICAALLAWVAVMALSSFELLPNHTPSNYEDRIRACFKANRWHEGGLSLDSALKEYPQVATFYELKGQYILHDIEMHPGDSIHHVDHSQKYELARYYLIKSIDMDEKNLKSRRMLLKIEIETRQYSSAIVYCNELLEQSPYNEQLWRTKIDLYRKLGNDQEADRMLERLLTIYPEDEKLREDVIERKAEQANQHHKEQNYVAMEKTMRELIELDPHQADYYRSLFTLYYRNGRMNEALQLCEQAVQTLTSASQREFFVAQRVGLLMEMDRHAEAQAYLASKGTLASSAHLQQLSKELDTELARRARKNDPYEAYAMVYEKQHTSEALKYLIGTSYQRNYYDDALYYIREGLRSGNDPGLLYLEYTVLKRMGHQKQAEKKLRELHEAFPKQNEYATELGEIYLNHASEFMMQGNYDEADSLLLYVYYMAPDSALTEASIKKLMNCYIQTKKYDLAEAFLEETATSLTAESYCAQKAMLLNMRGQSKEALRLLARQYRALPVQKVQERRSISYSYEEIAVPYIKSLVATGMNNTAWAEVQEGLKICPQSNDMLHYAISLSLWKQDTKQARNYALKGIETFPNDPYYKLKNAQLLIQEKDYSHSIDSLRALIEVYPGDSTIMLAFTDCSERMATDYMKNHQTKEAIAVLDTALRFNPDSHVLLYTKYLAYCKLKDWETAEKCLKGYKPDFREYGEYKRSLELMANQQMVNNMTLEYQRARLGSEDAITGNAYLSYTRKMPRTNKHGEKRTHALSFGLAYAGRDGRADNDADVDLVKGGTGIQISAAYERQFNSRLVGRAEAGWSNRYFPTLSANLSMTYDMKKNWQLMAHANYRWLKTYTGVWQMATEFAGYDQTGQPLYANVMKQTGWRIKDKAMIQAGIGAGKTFGMDDRFNVSACVDGFMLQNNLYFNSNAKMTFYPLMDTKSFVFAQAGMGTAPESSLIDQSLAIGFSDLNTFVSMGGQYFVNRYITLGLSGAWYTLLTQKESLSLPLHGTTAQTTKNYSNYFYVHASVILTFPNTKTWGKAKKHAFRYSDETLR